MKTQEKNKPTKGKYKKITWRGIPAFIKGYEQEYTLYKHFFQSIVWHIVGIIVLCILMTTLKFAVVNPILKANEKKKDIEFIINNHSKRKGGSRKSVAASSSANVDKLINEISAEQKSSLKPTKNKKRNNLFANPSAIPDDFSIPVPKMSHFSSGSGAGSSRRSGGSSSHSTGGGAYSSDGNGEYGISGSGGSGKGSGFNKNAVKKVVSTYDISPYVNELKRNVRWNWKAPKVQDGKSVELFLRIAKDGRLIILNVKRTSEVGEIDEAALNAVRKTTPLNPLPSGYKKGYLDVIFTFGANSSSIGSRF